MQRELSSFPFPPVIRMKLTDAGFTAADDLKDIKPSELSKEIGISKEEALDILQEVNNIDSKIKSQTVTVTAFDMLKDEQLSQNIVTFSEKLDTMLGGGIALTKITEICGAPGIGKTQLCLQLCVDVQIPSCFGGIEGEAIYIDTEGSYIVERQASIATATVQHCQHIANLEQNAAQLSAMETFTMESILSHIFYFRCHDHVELLALVHLLPQFVQEHPKVKLLVVDSVAFHFRHDFEDLSLRTRLLNGMSQSFLKLAALNKLAVVLTNQMTTKVQSESSGGSYLMPALGESWGHACTVRLILHWDNNIRYATLYKSPSKKEDTIPYQITMGGVRDISEQESSIIDEVPARKRPRTESS